MKVKYITHYTLMDVMLASQTQPTPYEKQRHQLTRIYAGLDAIERSPAPNVDDWRVCSDAVNLMETLVTKRGWIDCEGNPVDVLDNSGLLGEAVAALSRAHGFYKTHGKIRMDAQGIHAVRAVVEDYAQMLEILPHRVMVQCHRLTEQTIQKALQHGKRDGVVVCSL